MEPTLGNLPTTASESPHTNPKKKRGGWKAITFILGNETFERLAVFGLFANFMVYLTRELHLDQVTASNILSLWFGITNFAPLIGAFISDAYVGRFRTIAFASFGTLLGMIVVTLTSWLPQLHPPPCSPEEVASGECVRASNSQMGVLVLGLCFLTIGSSGPEGSIFSGVARVLVAAYTKRKLRFPTTEEKPEGAFYDPPLLGTTVLSKLPLTKQFRALNKGALIMEGELNPDGSIVNQWRLVSIQQVEEVKCLARIIPIWAAGILSLTSMAQQGTFTVDSANSNPTPLGIAPMSVLWLAPHLILMGLCEAFNIIGQIEFFNSQFPEHMRSIGNSLFSCSFAAANYVSTIMVNVVHHTTTTHSHPDWLTNDINSGRIDYFYYLIAVLSTLNLIFFTFVARRYQYKGSVDFNDQTHEVELGSHKA
ncbi:hypothetical protein ACSQ67_006054 [Phaseolus vulgaris]